MNTVLTILNVINNKLEHDVNDVNKQKEKLSVYVLTIDTALLKCKKAAHTLIYLSNKTWVIVKNDI